MNRASTRGKIIPHAMHQKPLRGDILLLVHALRDAVREHVAALRKARGPSGGTHASIEARLSRAMAAQEEAAETLVEALFVEANE